MHYNWMQKKNHRRENVNQTKNNVEYTEFATSIWYCGNSVLLYGQIHIWFGLNSDRKQNRNIIVCSRNSHKTEQPVVALV